MRECLALGILAAFVGFVAISLISLWLDIRRAVAAAQQENRHA